MANADSFWQRLKRRYRISVMNEDTLGEVWHFRLSKMGMFLWFIILFLLTFSLLALLVWLTPLRNYLPGYNANIRQELITEINRIDSLQNHLNLQNEYLSIIRNVVSGEVRSDSVEPLDSLALRQKAQLLEEPSAVTEEFISTYESKGKDHLTMFDATINTPVYTLFRPARGTIQQHYRPQEGENGISILTPPHETVCTVLSGTIVYAVQSLNQNWVVVIQHEGDYLSVYKQLEKPFHKIGDSVDAGEAIAIVGEERLLQFELWQKGTAINPEDIIAFF